jgi:hypothetical protein
MFLAHRKNNAICCLPFFKNPSVAAVDHLDHIGYMTGGTDKAEFFTRDDLLKTQTYVMVSFSAITAVIT